MTLATLKAVCAAYHEKAVGDLTVNSTDLFLVAANNARKNAEQLHDFEASRVLATLSIDGVTGGRLADAVIEGTNSDQVTVTGTLTPDATGVYTVQGSFAGYPLYILDAATPYFLYYNATYSSYIISNVFSAGAVSARWVPSPVLLVPSGTYVAGGTSTGNATATRSFASVFSGIKSVVAVQGIRSDGLYVPLDLTRADISIERDRYELELTDNMWAAGRYPSDAQFLAMHGGAHSLVLRGGSIYHYPRVASSSDSPLEIAIEGIGWLRDYVAADLLENVPSDFLVEHGYAYLQWSIIIELNHLFKTFVPRQEGNLGAPENMKAEAWRDLLLWDAYSVDANITRSR